MPELPDLTVFAENLNRMVTGRKVVSVEPQGLREFTGALLDDRIERVERWGKEVRFRTAQGREFFVHLMLTGGFVVLTSTRPVPSSVLTIVFEDGSLLAVVDPKGWAKVDPGPKEEKPSPDALDVTANYLKSLFSKRPKMLAKAFLIDQRLLRGIGNAYADEILWEARISPKSPVGKIPPEAVEALVSAIPSVLKKATDYLRKHHPAIISGEIRDFLAVHNPGRKTSPTGHRIVVEQIASKKTYYTDEQMLHT